MNPLLVKLVTLKVTLLTLVFRFVLLTEHVPATPVVQEELPLEPALQLPVTRTADTG